MSITGLLFLLCYFSGILLALIRRPIFGMYVYFFAFYAHPPARWWGGGLPNLRWSLVAALVTIIAVLLKDRRNHGWKEKKEIKLLIAFVFYVWLQNLWALSPTLHFEFSVLVTKFLLLTYLFHATVKNLIDLVGVITINIIGTAYYGWIGYTRVGGGRFEDAGTPGMNDGNLLSVHMVPILISASYILLCKYPKKKFLIIPFIALTLNGIFLTQSRGGVLTMVVAGFIALFFVPKSKLKLFKTYFILACVVGGSLAGPMLIERLNKTLDAGDGQVEKSAESRIEIIKSQFEMFKNESPIFGNGHRGTLLLSPQYISEEYMTSKEGASVRGSHNLFMALLVDQGLLGLSIYIFIPILLFYRLLKVKKTFSSDTLYLESQRNTLVLYAGLNVSLFSYWIASMGVNSLRLEIDIWYYSLIGIVYSWIISFDLKSQRNNS